MADLRQILAKDFEEVQTYIQSGNVVLSSATAPVEIEEIIQKRIYDNYGFEVPVLVRTCTQWQKIIKENPFTRQDPNVDTKRIYITLMAQKPAPENIQALIKTVPPKDRLNFRPECLYILYDTKVSASKLDHNLIERKLKVRCTSRNWRTTLKLQDICGIEKK